MSSDVLRGVLAHWERGEFAPSLAHLDPDVVIVNSISGRGSEGYGGARRLIGDLEKAFDEWSVKIDEIHDCPDGRRLAVGRALLRGRKTGDELDRPLALLFGFEGDRISRLEFFPNRLDEAYAAAGLERPA